MTVLPGVTEVHGPPAMLGRPSPAAVCTRVAIETTALVMELVVIN